MADRILRHGAAEPGDFRKQRFGGNPHDLAQILQHQLGQGFIRQLDVLLVSGAPDIAAQQHLIIRAGVQPLG
ncbi:hypothetical protein D3C76_1731970 [compost metagenome]